MRNAVRRALALCTLHFAVAEGEMVARPSTAPCQLVESRGMDAVVQALLVVGRGLAALVAGSLPRRRWEAFPALPIDRLAAVSGIVTFIAGVVLGVAGFLRFAWQAAGGVVDATLAIAGRQVRNQAPGQITSMTMQGASALSVVGFLFFTPLGLFATYLAVTGLVRAIAAWVDDPVGDPILTGIDAVATGSARRAKQTRARWSREREEGREVPDRLLPALSAGLDGFDYVVVASRRKADWTAGTFVITSDKWYTLGEPFEVRLPEGLRTVYPLREQKSAEVLRRGVSYELPPLEEGRLPIASSRH